MIYIDEQFSLMIIYILLFYFLFQDFFHYLITKIDLSFFFKVLWTSACIVNLNIELILI